MTIFCNIQYMSLDKHLLNEASLTSLLTNIAGNIS